MNLRRVAVWLSVLLLGFTFRMPAVLAAATGGYQTTVSVAPAAPEPGSTARITATVTSSDDVSVLVDIEVYDGAGSKVFQRWFDNQTLTRSAPATYTVDWLVPKVGYSDVYRVKVGVFNPGWGVLYHWNDEAATVEVAGAPAAPVQPGPPAPMPATPRAAALPAHFGIGLSAHPDHSGLYGWMPETGIPWDYAYQYLAGGVNTGQGWQTWNADAQFALLYAQGAAERKYMPVFSYYQLLQSAGTCNGCEEAQRDLANLNNPVVMSRYYQDFALLMQRLGTGRYDGIAGYGGPAIVHVEPDLSGYAMHAVLHSDRCFGYCTGQGNDPALLKASVAASGVPEVSGYPDTYQGFNWALLHLRDLYAPNVLLAFHISNWSTLQDVGSSTDPGLDVAALGEQAGTFAALSGTRQVPDKTSPYDLVFNDVADRDAGYYKYVYGRPNAFWDRENQTLPNFHRWEEYLGAAIRAAGRKAMVWQIPLGNQAFRSMNNQDGHYQDNRAEYFFSHIDELARTGIIGLLFGAGNAGSTVNHDGEKDGVTNPDPVCSTDGTSQGRICPDGTSTVADDDGGYLRIAAKSYYQSPYRLAPTPVRKRLQLVRPHFRM